MRPVGFGGLFFDHWGGGGGGVSGMEAEMGEIGSNGETGMGFGRWVVNGGFK